MPLSLRRGRVTAIVERHEGLLRLEVDGDACVAYPGVTGPVEVDDEVLVNVQARAARPRLGRVRRPLREPDARARPSGGGGRARDEAALHAAAVRGAARGGGRALAEGLGGMPGRLLLAAQPGRAGLRGARRACASRTCNSPGGALSVALSDTVRLLQARGLLAATAPSGPCFGRRGGVRRRRLGSGVGGGRGLRRGGLRDRPRDRRDRDEPRARRARGGGRRECGRRRSAAGRCSRRASRARTSATRHRASRTTRAPCCRSAVAASRSRGRRGSRRPAGSSRASRSTPRAGVRRAPGSRSRTWAAARTRSRRSSRPRSPPGGWRAELAG